ncbi:fungal-specific transcription factor domain-containing protein [Mycena galopus ATCC 62051]|nr:fungal-specific transcription factor domain-containing protein [Mycena galopus ATCC 62051]
MAVGDQGSVVPQPKRRRLPGACDICRKQKGNSAEMPGRENSRTAQDHITFILSGSNEYISGDPLVVYQVLVAVAQYARRLEEALAITTTAPSLSIQPSPPPGSFSSSEASETDTDSDDGLVVDSTLPESLQQITRDVSFNRFYGKSSSIHFIRSFMAAKMEATGDINPIHQRPEFWSVRPWELTREIFVPQLFPEPTLMMALIDHFFSEINILIYILHEITFRQAVAAGLHLHDQKFGAVVLSICALGAKFSDDRRVFLEQSDSEHTAGWLWFRQVRPIPASLVATVSLYEIQVIVLSVLYLGSASTPEVSWNLVGLGLRMAYDIGAHSRVRLRANHEDHVQAELYKRVYLVLVCCDTIMSSLLGRPRTAQFDVELPETLEGEPAIAPVYASLLWKMMEIWGRIQDDIYPIKRKDQNYQEIVAELDSELNKWVSSVPDQCDYVFLPTPPPVLNFTVRWDPNRQDLTTLNQSACLYGTYYHSSDTSSSSFYRHFAILGVLIAPRFHSRRLLSPPPHHPQISANAARSCAHVMDIQSKRGVGPLYNPQTLACIFDSALVLLMNVFHRSRPSADQSVQKCLNVLKVYERRFRDILMGMLAGVMENDGPSETTPSLKRPRGSDDMQSSISENAPNITQDLEQLRVSSEQEIERLLFLPLYTEDLGRLPVYEPFDFDSIFRSDSAFLETSNSTLQNHVAALLEAPFPGNTNDLTNAPFENWDDWGIQVVDGPN